VPFSRVLFIIASDVGISLDVLLKCYTELQVLPNNVECYAVKFIILLHILTFMNKLTYNPPCYHENIVFVFEIMH